MNFANFWKTVFGLCCLASLNSALESTEITTEEPHIRPCYIEKSKAAELLIRMNNTVQILSNKDRFMDCTEGAKIVDVPPEDFKLCSDERIARIQDDLAEVTGSLFEMASRLQEPQETQVLGLDAKKFQLMDSLHALRVFYGPLQSQCEGSQIVLLPFHTSVDYLEKSLDSVLALFQTPRPTRATLPPTTTWTSSPSTSTPAPAPPPPPTIEQFLNPNTTFAELLEMDALHPKFMLTALPQLISQRYAGRASDFDVVLTFVQSLNRTINQITGFNSLYETIQRYPNLPAVPQLVQFAKSVKSVYESSCPCLRPKLEDLMKDLGPLALIGERSDCEIVNVAYQRQLGVYDTDSPQSAYLLLPTETDSRTWRVTPTVQSNKFNFQIGDSDGFFYAADKTLNINDTRASATTTYETKSSERYVLRAPSETSQGVDWKLVAVKGKPPIIFRILTAKSSDVVMFAHKSATDHHQKDMRRVILGRANTSSHDFIPDADLWHFSCQPAEPDGRDV